MPSNRLPAMLAAHADWSVDPRKRWMAVARSDGDFWRIAAPSPVGDVGTLFVRLQAAAEGGPVVLGVDLPLGLPRGYVGRYLSKCVSENVSENVSKLGAGAPANFPAFLRALADRPDFLVVCTCLEEVSLGRPFYPARGVAGMTRLAHAAALGFADFAELSRWCDRATVERPAGASLFWTLGPNQSGKAAIAAWRDLLVPALSAPRPPRLWPFEGSLRALIAPGEIVVAETYPAEALRHLDIRLAGSKRRQADRARAAGALEGALTRLGGCPAAELRAMIADGFGADAAGEDRFDCLLGLLCVLNVLAGNRPDTPPGDPWLSLWEGWVLGQTAMPRLQTNLRSL